MSAMLPTRTLLSLLVMPFLMAQCKKEDPEPEPAQAQSDASLMMRMHWKFGAQDFHLDSVYTDAFGSEIKLTGIRFYLSQPWFTDDGGSVVADLPDRYFLLDASEGSLPLTIGQVNAHLHQVNFGVGLDSIANHQDPSTSEAPLNDYLLWWGWNTGRVFLKIEGAVDIDGDNDIDTNDGIIVYDVGTDDLRRDALITIHTDADEGGEVVIDFNVDVQRILQGVDVANNNNTHTTDNLPLALQLINNLKDAISHVE